MSPKAPEIVTVLALTRIGLWTPQRVRIARAPSISERVNLCRVRSISASRRRRSLADAR